MYESGNAVKGILGQDNLQWDVNRKQGALTGNTFDGLEGKPALGSNDVGREVSKPVYGYQPNQQV